MVFPPVLVNVKSVGLLSFCPEWATQTRWCIEPDTYDIPGD